MFLAFTFCAVFLDTTPAQPLTVTTIAGQFGVLDFTGAGAVGVGTKALFEYPGQLHADQAGNLYVCDAECIKKISPDLHVTVLAGHLGTWPGTYGYLDGMGTNALFNNPTDCAIDTNGNVYVVDNRNFVIRKIASTGAVTTFAGNGYSVYNDATGTNAGFTGPIGIAIDSAGNFYVSDLDSNGNRIRKITPGGVVSTLAGGPYNYEDGDGVGTNAQFVYPNGLAVDAAGTVYVADEHTIRKITPDGTVTTWVGDRSNNFKDSDGLGLNAEFNGASEIALDRSGGLYVVDSAGPTIRYVSAAGAVSTVAGAVQQYPSGSNNGVGSGALFSSPAGVTVGLGFNVYLTDRGESTILEGVPPTLAIFGSVSESAGVAPVRSNNPWQFTAVFTNIVSDLRLRVQSTTTPNIEASWTDLPGNVVITDVGGNWTFKTTDVPTGTQYFRVVASAPGYFDSASGPVGPETVLDGIAPFGFFSWQTTGPERNGALWTFTITEPSLISDLRLRIQSSENLTNWSDLPDGGQMGHIDATWTLDTTNLPLGQQFFRVVASAPTYVDRISSSLGPFNIKAALTPVTITTSGTGYHVLDLDAPPEMQDPAKMVYLTAVDNAVVQYIITGNLEQEVATITLAAEQYASAELLVGTGQTLTIPAVNAGPGASVELKGTINGEFALINQNGVGIVSQGAGNIVSQGAGNLTYDAGTAAIVSQGAGNIVSQGAGNIVSQGAGNIVSQGAGNVVSGPAIEKALSALKQKKSNGPIQPADNTQPSFTGQMTINGDYDQFSGTLVIAIAGTNTLNGGAQQFDQLVVSGTANLLGGTIAFGLFDPDDQTNQANVFQPPDGATFDVVVASNIVVNTLTIRGSIWGNGQFFSGSVVTRDDGLQAVRLVATHIPPHIFIQNTGTALQLIYATNYTGYTVESSPNLVNWSIFSTGTNLVVLSPTNTGRFFRLSKP